MWSMTIDHAVLLEGLGKTWNRPPSLLRVGI